MADTPRLSRVHCRVCGRTWHTADPLASWEAHWRYLHARERSMFEAVGR